MPRRIIQDMVMVKHPAKKPDKYAAPERPRMAPVTQEPKEPNQIKRSRYMLWTVALASVAICLFAVSFLFSSAEVTVNPKIKDVSINESLTASTSDSSFSVEPINGTESKTVAASGEKEVSLKAVGTVTIFNTYSSAAQPLAIATRLQGSNGRMYMTQMKITVPGMQSDGNAGKIDVGIYASAPGPEFNSDPLDFQIIGFKGTPKYDKFKVETATGTKIAGGFVGLAPVLSDADKATALSELKNNLKAKLLPKITIPAGYVLFKNATFLETDDANATFVSNSDSTATLSLQGTLYGVLIDEGRLTKKIAQHAIDKYDGSDVYISNIKDLNFSITSKDNATLASAQNINFTLSGPAKIVWRLDSKKFISDLLGKSKGDFSKVVRQYDNVDSANLSINPVWKFSIPDQAKDVKVNVNYPN